jgi:hypothetical protein
MSTLSGGPGIVTDGLVLSLDAANVKSYPGSGTVWRDISRGGNNGTLVNGPTFDSGNGGSIIFDGVDDGCRFPISTFTLGSPQNGTFSLTAKFTQLNNSNAAVFFSDGGFSGQLIYFYRNAPWSVNQYAWLIYFNNTTSTSAILHYFTYTPGEWYNTVMTFNSIGQSNLYVDGVLKNSVNAVDFVSWRRTGTNTPSINAGSSSGSGSISNFKYYNKALTPQEILQNFNATKTRFGL